MEKPNNCVLCAAQHNLLNIKTYMYVYRLVDVCVHKHMEVYINETEDTMMVFVQSLVHPDSVAINLLHVVHDKMLQQQQHHYTEY